MSLQDAIAQATRETLRHYLAADLVEQLSDEIVHRVGPEAEQALQSFLGFERARPAASRTKNVAAKPRAAGGRRKRRGDSDTLDDGAPRPQALAAQAPEREPAPSEMS